MDEGRLDKGLLDELIEECVHDITDAVPRFLEGDVVLFRKLHRFLVGHFLGEVDAGLLLDRLRHGNPTEPFGEIDVIPHPMERGLAQSAAQDFEKALNPFLHGDQIPIGLIKLDGSEFGVVAGIDALVAEDPSDLINAVDSPNHAFLQVELGGDAEVEVFVQSVVVGDERTGRGSAEDRGKNRGFDFHESLGIAVMLDFADHARTEESHLSGIVVDDEVHIAVAEAVFGIGEPMELLRKGLKAFDDVGVFGRADGEFAGLGLHQRPLDPGDVPQVGELENRVVFLAHDVAPDPNLDLAAFVLQVEESGFAHFAEGHDAASDVDGNVLRFQLLGSQSPVFLAQIADLVFPVITGSKRIDSQFLILREFSPPGQLLVCQFLFHVDFS